MHVCVYVCMLYISAAGGRRRTLTRRRRHRGAAAWAHAAGSPARGPLYSSSRLRFRVSGLGFRVQGLGFSVSGSGFRVSGLRFRHPCLKSRTHASTSCVQLLVCARRRRAGAPLVFSVTEALLPLDFKGWPRTGIIPGMVPEGMVPESPDTELFNVINY